MWSSDAFIPTSLIVGHQGSNSFTSFLLRLACSDSRNNSHHQFKHALRFFHSIQTLFHSCLRVIFLLSLLLVATKRSAPALPFSCIGLADQKAALQIQSIPSHTATNVAISTKGRSAKTPVGAVRESGGTLYFGGQLDEAVELPSRRK